MKACTRGEKGRYLWPRLVACVQKIAEGKTSYYRVVEPGKKKVILLDCEGGWVKMTHDT